MIDNIGRKIEYLRLSITDRCNLRCQYCMEENENNFIPDNSLITLENIKIIVIAASKLGVKKIRLTGGEPLLRADVVEIVRFIRSIPTIEEISITTNGILLEEKIDDLIKAGLDRINVSLDTVNPEIYSKITRWGNLEKVLNGITKALHLGIKKVKLNVVPLKGINDSEILNLIKLAVDAPIDVRFIELMPIGEGKKFCSISNTEILALIQKNYILENNISDNENGPATYYSFKCMQGKIGFISPLSHNFCENCNRIRVTATGFLKLCLHWNNGIELKPLLDNGISVDSLSKIMSQAISKKPEKHEMNESKSKDNIDNRKMNEIGG